MTKDLEVTNNREEKNFLVFTKSVYLCLATIEKQKKQYLIISE
jgi:hypothetical protein